ncbi:MAG: class I SAM-dependent methyltransferase [Fimbriimonadaceae bacterium]
MDRQRYSNIAHAHCAFASPVSYGKAMELLRRAGMNEEPNGETKSLLDIGCGFGSWTSIAANYNCNATGVDRNEHAIERAKKGPTQATFILGDAKEITNETFDIILCIGSTHALGGLEPTLEFCLSRLNPQGKIILGEGFWAQKPHPEYLKMLGGTEDEFTSHAENAQRITNAGYRIWYSTTSSPDEWDEYEGKYRSSMLEWGQNNPDDPETADYLALTDSWYDAYLRWGRETLGFGFYVASLNTPQLK